MSFSFKRNAGAATLESTPVQVGGKGFLHFSLSKGGRPVPMTDWESAESAGARWLLDLLSRVNDSDPDRAGDCVSIGTDGVQVNMQFLSDEMEGQETFIQRLLNLCPIFDGGLEVKGHGLLHEEGFRLSYNWMNSSWKSIHAERNGPLLVVGKTSFWLPSHACRLANLMDSLKESIKEKNTFKERLTDLAEFKRVLEHLPEQERRRIKQSSDISSLKLFYADSFRLEVDPGDSDFALRPVLLRKVSGADEDSEPVFEPIMPPAEQRRYGQVFQESTTLLPHYSMGIGKYLLISDRLNKVLTHVHKVQHGPKAERKSFLENSAAALLAEFQDIFEEGELGHIFSDRVLGYGDWKAKVVPWVKIPPQKWFPNGKLPDGVRGLCIGEKRLELNESSANSLHQRIESAIKAGQPAVDHMDVLIPASAETLDALAAIFPNVQATQEKQKASEQKTEQSASADNPEQTATEQKPLKKPCVMLVKENLETLEFCVNRTPRKQRPSNTSLPDALKTAPKPHQVEAFEWMRDHYIAGSRGILLADDMGLGKTYEALMFLAWLHEATQEKELPKEPLLIVAPTGLLKNWELEMAIHLIQKLEPTVRAFGYDIRDLKLGRGLDVVRMRTAGVILTTYETLTRYQTSFSAVKFSAVVFDEAQKLKNPGTQNYGAAASLNASFWIAMTGTPIENRLSDLWAIADLVQPGLLGTVKEFSTKYERAVLENKDIREQRLTELQAGIMQRVFDAPPFMLRRMKDEQLPGLPKKEILVHKRVMPAGQTTVYSTIVDDVKSKGRNEKGGVLTALQKLRACSLHPDYRREKRDWTDEDFVRSSARLDACFEILDGIYRKREKALVFVEYNDWHRPDFLPQILKRRYQLENLPLVINGQIGSAARQKRVNDFQSQKNKFDVMILSPKAGGVGLTLTAANHVVHLTRWWNPAVEDQATDRIYRLGQEKEVFIHYPLAIHPDIQDSSFDVLLDTVLSNKRKLRDRTLLQVPVSDEVPNELFEKMFGFEVKTQSLNDSYSMTEKEFESYTLTRLKENASALGLRVRPTPDTWGQGADLIIETTDGVMAAVVCCEHVLDSSKTASLSAKLQRAAQSLGSNSNVLKIGLTNASSISPADFDWLAQSHLHAIYFGEYGLTPERLLGLISETF